MILIDEALVVALFMDVVEEQRWFEKKKYHLK